MVSFDVNSLFTNVPLQGVVEICCLRVYNSTNTAKPTFSKQIFKELLVLATSDTYLSFNDELFRQIDGVANVLATSTRISIFGSSRRSTDC